MIRGNMHLKEKVKVHVNFKRENGQVIILRVSHKYSLLEC